MPNKCKQFGPGFQSEGFALTLVRALRSVALPPRLLFSVLLVLRVPRIRVFPPSYTDTRGILQYVHNVIVKAFYISMLEKKPRSLFANSRRAAKEPLQKLLVRRAFYRALFVAPARN